MKSSEKLSMICQRYILKSFVKYKKKLNKTNKVTTEMLNAFHKLSAVRFKHIYTVGIHASSIHS